MPTCYSSPDQCTSKLGKKIQYWRAERPDEWTMDEFIRDADALEAKVKELENELNRSKERINELNDYIIGNRPDKFHDSIIKNSNMLARISAEIERDQLREQLNHIKELYHSLLEEQPNDTRRS